MIKVAAAVLVKGKHIFIARRRKNEKLGGKWEFPGGKVEQGETLQACLEREMMEEFRIKISVGRLIGESVCYYSHMAVHLFAFWAEWEAGIIEPNSHDECRWVKISELDDYDFAEADLPVVEKIQQAGNGV